MNAFDFPRFCRDHTVPTLVEGHKHCRPGWVQTPCPFCSGNPGWHLGFNTADNILVCWRCGYHTLYEWVRKVTRKSHDDTKDLLDSYSLRPSMQKTPSSRQKIRASSVQLPAGCGPLEARHREYLEGRRFDPNRLIALYDLQGVGAVGDYKHRIIAPIYLEGQLISFQGRDVTGRSDVKYKACPQKKEVMDHHETLYALDLVPAAACVVVEGIADVWRLGPGAVATFGIKFRPAQVKRLARFARVFVLFDTDVVKGKAESLVKAEQLAANLASLGVDVEQISLDQGDPGEMAQSDADHLMRELGLM